MKKVLVLTDIGGYGGAEKILMMLCQALEGGDVGLEVLFGTDGPQVEKVAEKVARASVLRVPAFLEKGGLIPLGRMFKLLALWRRILFFSGDVVITNTLFMQIFGSPFAWLIGKKVVWYEHNIQPPGFRRWFIRAYARLFPTYIIAVSGAVRDVYSGIGKKGMVHVIHNGIHALKGETESQLKLRQEFDLNSNEFVVLAVSRLTPYKGLHLLIEAVRMMGDMDIRLFIIGEAGLSDKDVEYKESLVVKSGGQIKFLGWKDNVADWLCLADVFCAPAVMADPFPTTILEAMSLGSLCAVSDVGGQPEAVDHLKTGFVFRNSDVHEIISVLRGVKTLEPDEVIRIKDATEKRFLERFSFESYQAKISLFFKNKVVS